MTEHVELISETSLPLIGSPTDNHYITFPKLNLNQESVLSIPKTSDKNELKINSRYLPKGERVETKKKSFTAIRNTHSITADTYKLSAEHANRSMGIANFFAETRSSNFSISQKPSAKFPTVKSR